MKQMNIRAEAALLEVARRHHTTVEEVRREIRLLWRWQCVTLTLLYGKLG